VPPMYQIDPPPPLPPGPPPSSSDADEYMVLHPTMSFMESMRKKIAAIALFQRNKSRVRPFSGSLQRGIDIRRTLRSYLSPHPRLYVREITRSSAKIDHLNEPVVWLLNPVPRRVDSDNFGYSRTYNPDLGTQYIQWMHCAHDQETTFESNDKAFKFEDSTVLGFISYFDREPAQAVKQAMGPSFACRVPNTESSSVCSNCGLDWALHSMARYDSAWWDVLMMLGLRYCDKVLICVLPDGFRIASRVWAEARRLKKDILCIHLSSLPRRDVAALGLKRYLRLPADMKKDDQFWARINNIATKVGLKSRPLLSKRVTPK
jgi:hypothetical protein